MLRLSERCTYGLAAASSLLGILYWVGFPGLIPNDQPWGRADDVVVLLLALAVSARLAVAADRDGTARRLAAAGANPAVAAFAPPAPDRACGSLHGRIFLDICKTYKPAWVFSNSRFATSFVRVFAAQRFKVAYAFAGTHNNEPLRTIVQHTMDDFAPATCPAITKLYVALPLPAPPTGMRWRITIGNARYLVFGADMILRDRIHLGACYQSFLATLGQHSRRNLRKVRQHAADAALTHQVQPLLAAPSRTLRSLVARNHPIAFGPRTVDSIYRLLADHPRGFHSILRLPAGEAISCCSGFIEGDTAFILYQMNNGDYLRHNPSLTNRAFLIEALIADGIRDLVFINGCRGVLQHACQTEHGAKIWVIKRSFASLVCAALLLTQFRRADIAPKMRSVLEHLLRSDKREKQASQGPAP
ncbi:MAG: hypothetical protein WDN04_10280 [Rhodospirillales bacterium]